MSRYTPETVLGPEQAVLEPILQHKSRSCAGCCEDGRT